MLPDLMELVSFRVAAEVIVIVEDQYARFRARKFSVKVCCRKSTDTRTDNDQVVTFTCIKGRTRILPEVPMRSEWGVL